MHYLGITPIPQTGEEYNYDLTTVEAVNAELGLTSSTDNDALVAAQITSASQIIATMCGRVFAQQTVSESFDITWYDRVSNLNLAQWPIVSINSITSNDVAIDASNYQINKNDGILFSKQWSCLHGLLVVEYVGGFDLPDEAPPALSAACIGLIRERRQNAQRDPTVRDVWSGENRVGYFQSSSASYRDGMPSIISDLLTPFKRYAV